MRLRIVLALLAAGAAVVTRGSDVGSHPTGKRRGRTIVYDAIKCPNKPDLTRYGLAPMVLYDHTHFFGGNPKDPALRDRVPDERRVRLLAAKCARGAFVCINIEAWWVHKDLATAETSVRRLSAVIEWMRDERPDLKLGFFALLPSDVYRAYVDGWDSPAADAWRKRNRWLGKRLAHRVDAIFPAIYPPTADRRRYEKYVREIIREVSTYGKPVYPFTYNRFSSYVGRRFLPPDLYRFELELARRLGDGVVVYTDYFRLWNEEAPWWGVARRFAQETAARGPGKSVPETRTSTAPSGPATRPKQTRRSVEPPRP